MIGQVRVFITPVKQYTRGSGMVYADEFEATEWLANSGNSIITQGVDISKTEIGAYYFGEMSLSFINIGGEFNNPYPIADSRSFFPWRGRDQAKVRIDYELDGVSKTVFRGLVADEVTSLNVTGNKIKIRVTSLDSVLRKAPVSGGVVANGILISDAIKNILSRPYVTTVLNYDAANITVPNDITVDDVSFLFTKTAKEALDLLLLAGAAVLFTDSTGNVIVKGRDANDNTPHALYGDYDLLERSNIISVEARSGLAETYNQLVIGESTYKDDGLIFEQGLRKKELTNLDKLFSSLEARERIMQTLVSVFSKPKETLELETQYKTAESFQLFDAVTVDFGQRFENLNTAYYDVGVYDEAVYPKASNGRIINGLYKILGIEHNIERQSTVLQLKEV